MRRKYLSERDQLELFRALPGDLALRDAQNLMAYPFFSLAKTKHVVSIDFRAGAVSGRAVLTLCISMPSTAASRRSSILRTTYARSCGGRHYSATVLTRDSKDSVLRLAGDNRRERSACSAALGWSIFRRCALVTALELGNQQPSKARSAP